MSESKAGDAPRVWWREWAKSMLVGLYSASICGGSLHRAYLEDLGMSRDRIFLGYDVVDNAYFWRQSEKVRKHPAQFQHLPGLSEDTPFFLASARFIARKNLAGLLQAYDRYRDCMARIEGNRLWRLIILGDGEERERLEQMIVSRGLEEVTLAGFRQIEELPAYYALASAFIHPAYQEQWGLVVNEAMAAGLPVLVSKRCGCAPELVVDGENGFTFDPRRIDALAALMVKMSCGRVNLDAMGRASRVRIAEWGPNRFAEGLYRAVRVSL
jgi:glycosyltransferase involved in cell wall biosynthesis